jgi:hypothetical protein
MGFDPSEHSSSLAAVAPLGARCRPAVHHRPNSGPSPHHPPAHSMDETGFPCASGSGPGLRSVFTASLHQRVRYATARGLDARRARSSPGLASSSGVLPSHLGTRLRIPPPTDFDRGPFLPCRSKAARPSAGPTESRSARRSAALSRDRLPLMRSSHLVMPLPGSRSARCRAHGFTSGADPMSPPVRPALLSAVKTFLRRVQGATAVGGGFATRCLAISNVHQNFKVQQINCL